MRDCYRCVFARIGLKQGMRRKLKWVAGTAALALAVAAATPWPLSGVATRLEIARQVTVATGFTTDQPASAVIRLLPRPMITVEAFAARAPDGALSIAAKSLRADLRILPLIAGRLELANATFIESRIDVDLDRMIAPARPDMAARDKSAPPSAGLRSVALRGGDVHLHGGGRDIDLSDMDLAIDWRGMTAPLSARGDFNWRGEKVQTALWLGKPASLAVDDSSPVVARFESPTLTANFDGAAAGGPSYFIDGRVAVSATSPNGLFESLVGSAPELTEAGPISLDGAARLSRHELSIANARFSLAGSSYDGVLSASFDDRGSRFSGTLATDLLDLTPLVQVFARAARASNEAPARRLGRSGAGGADIDLRLSAARARLGAYEATRTGISILKSADQIEISLAEANAYKGNIKGRATIRRDGDDLEWLARGTVEHLDAGALGAAARRSQRITGEFSGEFALSAHGANAPTLLAGLSGTAKMDLANGEIAGLDLEQALRRAERRPLSLATELRGGKTQFNHIASSMLIDKGVAIVENAEGAGAGVAFNLTGAATIPTHELALRLKAWQASPSAPVAGAMQLAIDVGGPWDAPLLIVDPQSLIQHSRAAAPLRDPDATAEPASEPR